MKTRQPPHRRAFAALVPAIALLAGPVAAQRIQTTTTPPPVPVVQAAPAPDPVPAPSIETPAPLAPPAVVPTVSDAVTAPVAPVASRPRSARIASRAATPRRMSTPVSVNAAPAPVVAPATDSAPVPPARSGTTDTTTATGEATSIWPWLLAGIVLLGGLIALVARRRRVVDEVDEEAPISVPTAAVAPPAPVREPQFLIPTPAITPAIAPAIAPIPLAAPAPAVAAPFEEAAPVAAEDITIAKADADVVAALTAADAPVVDRPWLEFAMRPIRAGTNVDEALVEIELTIGNTGSVAARDVRVSTFMLAAEPASGAEMDRLLVEHHGNASSAPVTIEPGKGTRVDATLALSRAGIAGMFNPVILADARYTLPNGTEGRTAASFSIGRNDEGVTMGPIDTDRVQMHEDVEARLYGVPEHA